MSQMEKIWGKVWRLRLKKDKIEGGQEWEEFQVKTTRKH
jgi:hypothetical protein